MSDEPASGGIDYRGLANQLRVLGQENRLRLLNLLRDPQTVGNLLMPPAPEREGERPGRPITRQSVLEHLHKLEDTGLVKSRPAGSGRSTQLEYVAIRSQLFALIEGLRDVMATQRMVGDPLETQAVALPSARRDNASGPSLVLVHGAEPGKVFPLRSESKAAGRGWIIGRKAHCHACLDYDPYASSENAEILRGEDGTYRLLDLRTARNGTWLNWRQLQLGSEVQLRTGDVIGVGRSLLLFRAN